MGTIVLFHLEKGAKQNYCFLTAEYLKLKACPHSLAWCYYGLIENLTLQENRPKTIPTFPHKEPSYEPIQTIRCRRYSPQAGT